MVKGYIFDYGGTLDTGGCHWGKVLWHAYQRQGVPVSEAQFREAYVHAERTLGRNPIIQSDFTFYLTLETKLRLELAWLDGQASPGAPTSLADRYLEPLLTDLYLQTRSHTAASRAVLSELRRRYPLVLVSNFYGNVSTVLAEFGLDGLFDHVVESAVVGVRKPDPRIFTLGVEALGMEAADVVVVGDSIDKDIVPAKRAGCQTVWTKGEQWTDDPVDESLPDRVITNLTELL